MPAIFQKKGKKFWQKCTKFENVKKIKRAASAIPRMKLLEYALDIEDYDTLGTLMRENITLLIILR